MECDQRAEQRRVDVGGHRFRAVDPGENLLVGNVQPALVFVEFGLAHGGKPRVGKAAEHQIHFADAAMPASGTAAAAAARSSPSLEIPLPSHLLQRQKPGGSRVRVLYRGLRPRMSAARCPAQARIARKTREPAWRMRPLGAQSAVCRPHQPSRRRAQAGEALCRGCSAATLRASSTCCSICRRAPSTAARGRNCETCRPARW